MLTPGSNGEGNAFPAITVLAIRPARNNAVEVTARPASGGPPGNWRWAGRGGAWVAYITPPWQAGGLGCFPRRGAGGAGDEAHVDGGELPAVGVADQDEGGAGGFGDGVALVAAAGVGARG